MDASARKMNEAPSYDARYSLMGLFAEQPLSDDERRHGRALRVALCLRSAEGAFEKGPVSHLWVILSARRAPKRPGRPALRALYGDKRRPERIQNVRGELLGTHEITLDGEGWSVAEYSFCVSDEAGRILVTMGTDYLKIDRAGRKEILGTYDGLVANASVDPDYPEWLERRRARGLAKGAPESGPLMSIVTPAYKTPPDLLRKMVQSVLDQTYGCWELVIVNASPEDEGMRAVLEEFDDKRIFVVECPQNLGIVGNTNLGIGHATGDYVSFFDHDDVVEPHALAELVRAIESCDERPGLLYCDEDNVDEEDRPFLPLIKPGANPDFLLSNNYVIHWLTVRSDLLAKVEPSGPEVEGAQDYDLTLKIMETGAEVVRVPEVLYHWRIHSGSTAGDPASKEYAQGAGSRAIEAHLGRTGVSASVGRGPAYFTYRVDFDLPDPAPALDVVGEVSGATREALARYTDELHAEVRFLGAVGEGAFDPSTLTGTTLLVTGEHDLDFASLRVLVACAEQAGVFSASPRVVRQDGLLDFAGCIVRPDGSLGRLLRYLPESDGGYVGRAQRPYDMLVAHAECCVVSSAGAAAVRAGGGFETMRHAVAAASACAWEDGMRNVFLPYATSRLNAARPFMDDEPTPVEARDRERLLGLIPELLRGDPTHSPSFDPWSEYYRLNWAE